MSKAALLEELPASHWRVCTLKRAVLVLFVLQTTSYVLLIRYSKTRLAGSSAPPYLSTVTVLLGEVFKLLACLVMVARAAGGVTPMLSQKELDQLGFKLAAYPLDLLNASIVGMRKALDGLATGEGTPPADVSLPFAELQEVVGFPEYYAQEERYRT